MNWGQQGCRCSGASRGIGGIRALGTPRGVGGIRGHLELGVSGVHWGLERVAGSVDTQGPAGVDVADGYWGLLGM